MCDSRQNQESSDLGMAESVQWHTHIQDVLEQVARFESLSTLVFPGAGGIFTHTHTHTLSLFLLQAASFTGKAEIPEDSIFTILNRCTIILHT